MSETKELRMTLVYRGIEIINACIEKLPAEERAVAIITLREHLEHRAYQCGLPSNISYSVSLPEDNVDDLL